MTNDENPFGFFSGKGDKRKVKPSKPKPEVILHGRHGTMPAEEFHLHGWKTTCDKNGEVSVTVDHVAKGCTSIPSVSIGTTAATAWATGYGSCSPKT